MRLSHEEREAERKKSAIEQTRRAIAFVRGASPEQLAEALARNRVKRGKRFLQAHKPGWWRNCLNSGRSRIHVGRGEESPLALAYEYDVRFADEFGYVQDYFVQRGLGIEHRARRLGFDVPLYPDTPFRRRFPAVVIGAGLLDRLWADLVENPPGEWRIQYRHAVKFDEYIARAIARDRERRPHRPIPWWQRLCMLFAETAIRVN